MKKTVLIALASVMLVILSSFRSSVQPEQALNTQTKTAISEIQKNTYDRLYASRTCIFRSNVGLLGN
jgi:hypothetical protein